MALCSSQAEIYFARLQILCRLRALRRLFNGPFRVVRKSSQKCKTVRAVITRRPVPWSVRKCHGSPDFKRVSRISRGYILSTAHRVSDDTDPFALSDHNTSYGLAGISPPSKQQIHNAARASEASMNILLQQPHATPGEVGPPSLCSLSSGGFSAFSVETDAALAAVTEQPHSAEWQARFLPDYPTITNVQDTCTCTFNRVYVMCSQYFTQLPCN